MLFKKFRFSLDKKRDESSKGRTSIFQLKRPSSQTQTDIEKENPSSVSPDSLKNVRRGGKEFDLSEASDEYKENPYQDISRETGLLMEIKDILDELNILKKLAHDQDRVSDMWGKIKSKQKTSYPATTSEISLEIQGMIEDAQSVQRDINTLLDLKQKEASILEAKATREQSDALMTFTVVTIIFVGYIHFLYRILLTFAAACLIFDESFRIERLRFSSPERQRGVQGLVDIPYHL